MSNKNIRIYGRSYSPEELGLKYIFAGGKKYLDVTPFWIDSKKTREIEGIVRGTAPDTVIIEKEDDDS